MQRIEKSDHLLRTTKTGHLDTSLSPPLPQIFYGKKFPLFELSQIFRPPPSLKALRNM